MNDEGLKQASELELLERDFHLKLRQLPPEIAKKWESKFDALSHATPDFFIEFQTFLNARRDALASTLEVQSRVSEEIQKEIRAVQDIIQGTFGDTHYFLGNGYTSEVYELPIAPHLCVKYIKDQKAYDENNHLRVEYKFLEELRQFSVSGVRTPIPYFIRIHPSEGHAYGMERIMGKTLSRILERPDESINLIKLVKAMDRKDVEKRLIEYIEAVHSNFNITHGDLFMRNLMLNEQGEFFVIDFGKSKQEEIGENHEARQRVDIATITSEIRKFFQNIDTIEVT